MITLYTYIPDTLSSTIHDIQVNKNAPFLTALTRSCDIDDYAYTDSLFCFTSVSLCSNTARYLSLHGSQPVMEKGLALTQWSYEPYCTGPPKMHGHGEELWRREWQPTPVFLPREPQKQYEHTEISPPSWSPSCILPSIPLQPWLFSPELFPRLNCLVTYYFPKYLLGFGVGVCWVQRSV